MVTIVYMAMLLQSSHLNKSNLLTSKESDHYTIEYLQKRPLNQLTNSSIGHTAIIYLKKQHNYQ